MKPTDKPIPETHVELLELIQDIESSLKGTSYEILSNTRLDGLSEDLKDQCFRLAVMGPWSSGKSCLINRLIGEDPEGGLLPVAAEASTAKLTILTHGSARVTKVWNDDAREEIIAEGESESREALKKEAITLEDAALRVEWPSDFFAAGGELVDTPGLFDANPDRSAISLEAMETFHSIVFVVRHNMTVDQKTINFLKDHFSKYNQGNFFFLVNKIDRIDEEETSAEAIVDQCYTTLQQKLGSSDSAHLARETKIDNLLKRDRFFGVSALMGDGLKQALQAIREYLQRGAYETLVLVATGEVDSVLDGILKLQIAQKNACFVDMEEFGEILKALETYNPQMMREIAANKNAIQSDFTRITESLSKEIQQLIEKIKEEGLKETDIGWWERITSPADIHRDLETLRHNLRDRLMDELETIDQKRKDQCIDLCNTYNDFYKKVVEELGSFASRMDKALEIAEEFRKQQEGSSPRMENTSNKMAGEKSSLFEAAAAVGAGGAAAYLGGGAAAALGVHAVAVANFAWMPMWIAGPLGLVHPVAMGGLAGALGVAPGVAFGLAALPLGILTAGVLLAFFNNRKATNSIKEFKRWIEFDFSKLGTDTSKTFSNEMRKMGTGIAEAMEKGLIGAYQRLHQFGVTIRDGKESNTTSVADEAIAQQISQWREINSRISTKAEKI